MMGRSDANRRIENMGKAKKLRRMKMEQRVRLAKMCYLGLKKTDHQHLCCKVLIYINTITLIQIMILPILQNIISGIGIKCSFCNGVIW